MRSNSRAPSGIHRGLLALVALQLLTIVIVTCDRPAKRLSLPKTFDYGAYVQKYNKQYASEAETLSRANLFYARTLGIFKMNSLYAARKTGHFLKQNEYTDMTPGETRRALVIENGDLVPVLGANVWPNAPADQFSEYHDDDDGGIQDGYSRASSADEAPLRKPIVNFFEEPKRVRPRELVRKLSRNSDTAQALSRVIEAAGARGQQSQQQQKVGGVNIPFKPVVRAENRHYDPSLVPSFAWFEDVDTATSTFAEHMMEDFVGNLEPYPPPQIPTGRVLKDEDLPRRGAISSVLDFVSTIKDFYDFFSRDPGDEDDDDDLVQIGKLDGNEEPKSPRQETQRVVANESGEIVYDIDWRRTGCIPRPKAQSKCNACYAFATLDLLEFFYCRQKRTLTEFSVQYVIDCGGKADLHGCRGGKLSNVGVFVQKFGLQLNSAYPYRAMEHECPYDRQSDAQRKSWALRPTIAGWRMFPEMQAWYRWLPKSPIIVGLNMPSDFLAYAGGVHDGADCTQGMVHAMLLVGSGKQDGKPFWLLKNTFAESWGEAGYFRLSKKAPIKCFNSAIVARVSFQ